MKRIYFYAFVAAFIVGGCGKKKKSSDSSSDDKNSSVGALELTCDGKTCIGTEGE